MSLPIPLRVHLRTGRLDRDVTADARDLVFRWTDPGGYASCTVPLDRPLALQPDEIAYYGQLVVTDAHNGQVVWDGRQEDPGRSGGSGGEVWDLAAVGGQAHTRDRTVPLIYAAQMGGGDLEKAAVNTPGHTVSSGEDPGGSGKDAVTVQFPQGLGVSTGSRANVRYTGLARAGQKVARVDFAHDSGIADANYQVQAIMSTGGVGADVARDQAMSTGGGGSLPKVVGTDWTNGRNTLDLRLVRAAGGITTIAGDLHWTAFTDVNVLAMRYNAAGVELVSSGSPAGFGGYTTSTVLASDVVADLLGRLLTQYDGAGATIATTTFGIDQLAYPDGVTPERVLQDLLALESGHTWRVWERNAAGKFRFEFAPIPAQVRYEADLDFDQYDSQGSADGLYNQVTVRWRDSAGRVQATTRTATVPALDAAGLTRTGSVDLGSDVGSVAAAQRAGDRWLAERQFPANGGQLSIARPIVDLQTGRMVQPWEIRPALIRVRGILPRPDALNGITRDGVTIFRIVSSEYRASSGAATLELDSYARTTPRLIADLMRNAGSQRRN